MHCVQSKTIRSKWYIYTFTPPRVCVCLLCVFAVVREEVVVAARKEREKVITDDMTVGRYR